ncbi:MAG: MgtC/SapB family protein [Thermoplasmata archaeon]|nr:MAG: MgtC/SapB family protein [Thermoplasmata archaeon]
MVMELQLEFIIKIGLSILCGGIIGLERESSQHPAGLRTLILVCLGSTLFMFVPYLALEPAFRGLNINLDVTRVAAGVVTGIGFLGAGVIFKEGTNVKGLTTAASIWVVASIGLLVGIGFYIIALFATIVITLVLHFFHIVEREYFKYDEFNYLKIKIKDKPEVKANLEKLLLRYKIKLELHNFNRGKNKLILLYEVEPPRTLRKDRISNILLQNPDVLEIAWQD